MISSSIARFTGMYRFGDVMPFAGPSVYSKTQVNCSAVTFTCSAFLGTSPLSCSTIALMIAIAVTSAVGIAVHTISSPVWPWIGGPSESSSGWARNRQTE